MLCMIVTDNIDSHKDDKNDDDNDIMWISQVMVVGGKVIFYELCPSIL